MRDVWRTSMDYTLLDRAQKARLERTLLWFLLVVVAISAFVLMPLSYLLASNVLLRDTVWPMLNDFLLEISNYIYFWGSFAAVLYVIYRYGFRESKGAVGLYCGAALIRYLAYFLIGCVMSGFPTSFRDAWQDELVYLLLDVLMDLAQMGLVLLFAYIWMARQRHFSLKKKSYPAWLPYEGMMALKQNPLLRVTAVAAIIPAGIRLLSRVIYDVSLGGAIDSIDLVWQIIGYASDILYVIVGYLLMLWLLSTRYVKDTSALETFELEHTFEPLAEEKK